MERTTKDIVFATSNEGKKKEIQFFLSSEFNVKFLSDIGFNSDIEETGKTFEENAFIKAKTIWDITGGIVLADDSGLCIDALNGEPGINSHRYVGDDVSYEDKCMYILSQMNGIEDSKRTAKYITVICAILPNGEVHYTTGTMYGRIGHELRGNGGFGYDPIFVLPRANKSFAELAENPANGAVHEHRSFALASMRVKIHDLFK